IPCSSNAFCTRQHGPTFHLVEHRWSLTAMRATIVDVVAAWPCAQPLRPKRTVAEPVNRRRTQNGHIRNDTRDVSRRIRTVENGLISSQSCVASDRDGKEG